MSDLLSRDYGALSGVLGSTYGLLAGADTESQEGITSRKMKSDLRHETVTAMKKQKLAEVMPELPAPGECYHVVSNGDFDYWTWVPVLCGYIGTVDEMYASTWVINRASVAELLEMLASGAVRRVSFLGGDFMKTGDTAVYATLLQGLAAAGMRMVCLRNHAKVTLLASHESETYIVLEGSANYTANPRIEQNIVANDRRLYDFHRGWMEEVLARAS